MEHLNELLENAAYKRFQKESGIDDVNSKDKQQRFILSGKALFCEFAEYMEAHRKRCGIPDNLFSVYNAINDQGYNFIQYRIWPRLKQKYMEDVVKDWESRQATEYKVTVERI
jgi:hypothetical protein